MGRTTNIVESMNQDIELMRRLLLCLADAETWEVSYCEKQVSLKPDGSVDKVGMYNNWPGTSLEEGHYEVVCFRTLPPYIVQPIPGRESTRDQFLWYGRLNPPAPSGEQYSISYGDDKTKDKFFYKSYTYLPAGYPMRRHWMGRDQFQVSYNLNQLDLAGLLRVRYFHAEDEWNTEPPVSMYLTPKGADFVACIRDTQKWEDLKTPQLKLPDSKKTGIAGLITRGRKTSKAVKDVGEVVASISMLYERAKQTGFF